MKGKCSRGVLTRDVPELMGILVIADPGKKPGRSGPVAITITVPDAFPCRNSDKGKPQDPFIAPVSRNGRIPWRSLFRWTFRGVPGDLLPVHRREKQVKFVW